MWRKRDKIAEWRSLYCIEVVYAMWLIVWDQYIDFIGTRESCLMQIGIMVIDYFKLILFLINQNNPYK